MIEKLREQEKIIYAVSLTVLLAFFMQLFGFPNKLSVLCSFLICGIYFILQKKILVGIREILIVLAMALYIWFSGKRNLTGLSIVMLPLFFQLASRYVLNASQDKKELGKRIGKLLGIFVLGYTLHAVLNAGMYWIYGFAGSRAWKDVWTGMNVPATQQVIYFLPILALAFPAILYMKRAKILCGVSLIAVMFSLWFSAITGSRTPLAIFVIVLLWEVLLWCAFNWKEKQTRKQLLIYGTVFFLILLAGGLVMWLNWEKIQASPFYAAFGRDGGILHNVRFEAQKNAVAQLFKYPFGGYQMDLGVLEMAHNVWLDTAKAAGIFPFAVLVAYTVLNIYDLFKMMRNRVLHTGIKYVLSGLWLVMMLYYMVEPALEANVQYMIPWFYINGIICEINCKNSNAEKRKDIKWNLGVN